MNLVTIIFEECSPDPSQGYRVWWRVAGSGDPLTNAGDFFSSPAVFQDSLNPSGTQYEGIIVSHTREGLCNTVNWSTQSSESGSSGSGESGDIIPVTFKYYLADEYECPDCLVPVRTDVLVRLPASHTIQIGKYYEANPNLGFAYQLVPGEQPSNPHIVLTTNNFTNCGSICSE